MFRSEDICRSVAVKLRSRWKTFKDRLF